MATSLEEYARQHPQQAPEEQPAAETMGSYLQEIKDKEAVEQLKAGMLQQLENGNEPQFVLYTAIKAIGILTHDKEFAEAGKRALDAVYGDLAQQSLLTDNAAIAMQRLEERRAEYNEKMRRELNRNLAGYRRLEQALKDALKTIDILDQPEE